jgi:hypothetical protein
VPLAARLGAVDAAHRPALVVNITVLVVSGALAVYYLLLARATRVWSLRVWSLRPAQKERQAAPLEEVEGAQHRMRVAGRDAAVKGVAQLPD